MSNLSPCLDRYVNRYVMQPTQQPIPGYFQMHQYPSTSPAVGPNSSMFGCYPNGWTGIPLISTVSRKPRKYHNNSINNSSQSCDYNESAMSQLAIHAQGAPLIFSGKYKAKPFKKESNQSKENSLNNYKNHVGDKSFNASTHNYDTNENCLPRIIKPRKRRKKDRKLPLIHRDPISMAQLLPDSSLVSNVSNIKTTTDSPAFDNLSQYKKLSVGHDDFFHKSLSITTQSSNYCSPNKIYGHELQPSSESTLKSFFNSSIPSFKTSSVTNITSSCSCRLCDPFCKIWAFSLRRSCSDNSADLELYTGELSHSKKDVGVIGGNRTFHPPKSDWSSSKHSNDNDFSSLYHQSSNKITESHIERLRQESLSDSGDSGCDLLSGCLTISDDVLANVPNSVLKRSSAVLDPNELISENLNDISKQLSNITLLEFNEHVRSNNQERFSLSSSSDSSSVFSDNSFTYEKFENFDAKNSDSQILISPILVNKKQTTISCMLNDKDINVKQQVQDSVYFPQDSKAVYNCNDLSIWKNRLFLNLENSPKSEGT